MLHYAAPNFHNIYYLRYIKDTIQVKEVAFHFKGQFFEILRLNKVPIKLNRFYYEVQVIVKVNMHCAMNVVR